MVNFDGFPDFHIVNVSPSINLVHVCYFILPLLSQGNHYNFFQSCHLNVKTFFVFWFDWNIRCGIEKRDGKKTKNKWGLALEGRLGKLSNAHMPDAWRHTVKWKFCFIWNWIVEMSSEIIFWDERTQSFAVTCVVTLCDTLFIYICTNI